MSKFQLLALIVMRPLIRFALKSIMVGSVKKMSSINFVTCSLNQLPCPAEYQSLVSLADLVAQAISAIEPAEIAAAYAFGAASVVTWWGLGFVIAAALKAMNKAQLVGAVTGIYRVRFCTICPNGLELEE